MLDDVLLATGMSPVLCIPLTSKLFKSLAGLRVTIAPRGRLLKLCYVMPEQARALDRDRFGEGPLTVLSAEEMSDIELAFLGVCGMAHYITPQH